jgi:hypothetical protein
MRRRGTRKPYVWWYFSFGRLPEQGKRRKTPWGTKYVEGPQWVTHVLKEGKFLQY